MMRWARSIIIVIIIVHLALATEVCGPLVFVRSSILQKISCNSLAVCKTGTYVLISSQDLPNFTTRVLIQLFIIPKDYDRDIDRTKDGKLMRLLEQTAFALKKSSANTHLISNCLEAGRNEAHTQSDFYHP
jgi:uncharacterized membrane protein